MPMHGEYKEPGGKLVVVDLTVENAALANINLAGDFFLEPDDVLDRLRQALTGAPAEASASELISRLEGALVPGDILFGVSPAGIATAVRRALGRAVAWEDLEFEIIAGPTVPPAVNMALDELLPAELAAGRRGPILRFWEWDAPLLVMGSFQSYDNEVNPDGLARHGIVVSRRITGGGAMFMEPGNCITYSLYVPTSLVDGMSFEESYAYLDAWVIEALATIGVKARYVPLNDIASKHGKIGGAAQKRFASGYLLHHVTMAYDIDAEKMLECLRIGKEKLRDKGTRSAAKRVDPMRSQTGMTREDIMTVLQEHFATKYRTRKGFLRRDELAAAHELAEHKFLDPAWVKRIP